MELLLIILILVILFGWGGYHYRSGWSGYPSVIDLILFVIVVVVVFRLLGIV